MDPLRGDLILSREESLFSLLVQWITGSQYSHIGIYLGNDQYISAVPFKGVSVRAFSTIRYPTIYRWNQITPEQVEGMINWGQARVGHPYDFWQCVILSYRILFHKLDTYGKDTSPDSYECMEFVGEACASVGITFGGRFVDNLLPKQIVESGLLTPVA